MRKRVCHAVAGMGFRGCKKVYVFSPINLRFSCLYSIRSRWVLHRFSMLRHAQHALRSVRSRQHSTYRIALFDINRRVFPSLFMPGGPFRYKQTPCSVLCAERHVSAQTGVLFPACSHQKGCFGTNNLTESPSALAQTRSYQHPRLTAGASYSSKIKIFHF